MAIEPSTRDVSPQPTLRVRSLSKRYTRRADFLARKREVLVLDDINLSLWAGSTTAIVGESGAGKSTLARCVAMLEEPSSGEIWFEGNQLRTLGRAELRRARARFQLIFQDAASALNPRLTAQEIVLEPLAVMGRLRPVSGNEARRRAAALMEQVGLSDRFLERRPSQFSGGERQRLTIARALALEPALLIMDEALTGLDLSIQAQIVNLLLELQRARSLGYLFITHDLRMVGHFADEVAVLHQGRIVEAGLAAGVLLRPQNRYTQELVGRLKAFAP